MIGVAIAVWCVGLLMYGRNWGRAEGLRQGSLDGIRWCVSQPAHCRTWLEHYEDMQR